MPKFITAAKAAKHLNGAAMPSNMKMFEKLCKGQRIAQIGYVDSEVGAVPMLILENGVQIEVFCDDEGNGPGVLIAGDDNDIAYLCHTEMK